MLPAVGCVDHEKCWHLPQFRGLLIWRKRRPEPIRLRHSRRYQLLLLVRTALEPAVGMGIMGLFDHARGFTRTDP